MRLLHLLQKHYSGHLDRRPPNEKGEQKSAFFITSKYLQLRDMNEKHLSCDLSGPITGEGQGKNQNPTIKPNTKGTILFFSVLVCSLFKREEKRNLVFKPTCWRTVCFYLSCTSFAWIKSTGTVLWLNSAIETMRRDLIISFFVIGQLYLAFNHYMSFKTQLWRLIENTDSFTSGHAESTTDRR